MPGVVSKFYLKPRSILRRTCQNTWVEVLVPKWAKVAVITPLGPTSLSNPNLRLSHNAEVGAVPNAARTDWEIVGYGNAYEVPVAGGVRLFVCNDSGDPVSLTFSVAFEQYGMGDGPSCECSNG